MSNKVEFGLEKVHVAFYSNDGDVNAWDTPEHIPGAVSMAASPEGDQSKFFADNIAYYISNTNNGYSVDLGAAMIPDAILADMLGWLVDDDGMLVEVADGEPQPFALLFEVKGDAAKRRSVYYHCTASRPKVEAATQGDKTDIKTATLSLAVTPLEIDDRLINKGVMERTTANASVFDAWFDAVTEPTIAVS